MRVWGKRALLGGIAAFVVAQFIPVTGANPLVDPAQGIFTRMIVPPEIGDILTRACQDCHSNLTVWPWYSRIAPVSWLTIVRASPQPRCRGARPVHRTAALPAGFGAETPRSLGVAPGCQTLMGYAAKLVTYKTSPTAHFPRSGG